MSISIKKIKRIIASLSKNYRHFTEIFYCEVKDILKKYPNSLLIDVRSPQEYKEYHLYNSISIPLYELESKIQNVAKKEQTIILYCQSGTRSKKAAQTLQKLGYEDVFSLKGGLDAI